MTQATADLVAALEAERLAPTPPPAREYPDGPTARYMRERAEQRRVEPDRPAA